MIFSQSRPEQRSRRKRERSDTVYRRRQETYYFSYALQDKTERFLGDGLAVGLCTEGTRTMTFTGTYIGMFAELGTASFQAFEVKCWMKEEKTRL